MFGRVLSRVLMLVLVQAHAMYPPSWFNPLWQPAGPPGSHGPPYLWYNPDDGAHLPPDLPVPSILHEAYDGRTFPPRMLNTGGP